ncbi:hypothetical protein BCR34DRAFT_488301 [Clohesyomyces aquaticus]|uniref:DUF7729 domain-containing protein n=1 Tax=Clohesyomyces aquaticus TaxID=1231657 RepID=A0A1Y1ZET2_9PLEO|nr:hypothetical protein BCR34DRAFT_488301 [Clohesyomyces aquaticus]
MFHQHKADSATAAGEQGSNVCSNPRLCHSYIPSPARARRTRIHLNPLLSITLIFVVLTSLFGAVSASDAHGDRQRRSASVPVDELTPAWKGPSLLIDTRPAPVPPMLMQLQRRDSDATTSAPASRTTGIKTDPSATQSAYAIPRPFDTALSNNYTTPCAAWFRRLLSNSTFNACHPFSLMLQTSSSFFDASKSFVGITQTLQATCNVNATICLGNMNALARELRDNANCAVDYANDNPQVLQAYNGLLAYYPLYQASCLKDDGGQYCYANAVTNTTATGDAYPYYLPLGVTMPGGARPTCNTCLQDAMAIFSSFAGNQTQPISKTYNAAAQQIDLGCGPTFINKTAVPLKGAASSTTPSFAPTITLFIMIFFYFFQ